MPPLVKVCVLGSTGVGKSKLINQFVYNYYDDQYEPTMSKGKIVHCSTMINGNLYQMKIVDMPAIKEFPSNSSTEWSEYQQCLLRNAHAYIFVFDLNTPVTFHYVKILRDQLFESRNMQNVPVWIVGNKADLCLNVLATMRSHHRHDHHHHHPHHPHHHHHHHSHNHRNILHPTNQILSPYEDLTPACKEFSNLVRKHWKCNYIECSAKYNWRIVAIFRELLKSIDPIMINQTVADQSSITQGMMGASLATSAKQQQDQTSSIKAITSNIAAMSNDTSLSFIPSRGLSPASEPSGSSTTNRHHNSNRICRIS